MRSLAECSAELSKFRMMRGLRESPKDDRPFVSVSLPTLRKWTAAQSFPPEKNKPKICDKKFCVWEEFYLKFCIAVCSGEFVYFVQTEARAFFGVIFQEKSYQNTACQHKTVFIVNGEYLSGSVNLFFGVKLHNQAGLGVVQQMNVMNQGFAVVGILD